MGIVQDLEAAPTYTSVGGFTTTTALLADKFRHYKVHGKFCRRRKSNIAATGVR